MQDMLIEICCACGYVHRFGDYRPGRRRHYHWADASKEARVTVDRDGKSHEAVIHKTMCAIHLGGSAWLTTWESHRAHLDPRYAVPGSLNAPFTDKGDAYSPRVIAEWDRKYEDLVGRLKRVHEPR